MESDPLLSHSSSRTQVLLTTDLSLERRSTTLQCHDALQRLCECWRLCCHGGGTLKNKKACAVSWPPNSLFVLMAEWSWQVWYCATAPAFTLAASQVHNIQTADGDGGCREAPAHPNLDLAACTTVETTVFFTLTALVTGQNYKCCTTSLCSSIYSLQRDPF